MAYVFYQNKAVEMMETSNTPVEAALSHTAQPAPASFQRASAHGFGNALAHIQMRACARSSH
jgi:hypothetical protein